MSQSQDTLHPVQRFGNKYYRTSEVEKLLSGERKEKRELSQASAVLRQENQQYCQQNDRLQAELNQCKLESQQLLTRFSTLEQERDQLLHQNKARDERIRQAEEERSKLTARLEDLQQETERAAERTRLLSQNLEREQQAVLQYESLTSDDAVTRANERARKIISDAVAESDRILHEITVQRSRVIAAGRCAYYNALQFKASLAERFGTMEHDLDEALDVLRMLEHSPISEPFSPNEPKEAAPLQGQQD